MLSCLLIGSQLCFAQDKEFHGLKIGDNVKGLPTFKNVVNFGNKELSLANLKGKLVIIDFWTTGCPSCIAAMPRLERLQEEFRNKIQIILVNPWESKEKIEQKVSKMKILRPGIGLTSLPNVYGDTKWRFIFPHSSVPHHIWIDPNGKVIASTSSINTTPEHIQQLLDGQKLNLSIKNDLMNRGYDVRKEGLMHVGDTSLKPVIYSSIFRSNHGLGGGSQTMADTIKGIYKEDLFNETMLSLYQRACRGYHVSLEVRDKTPFVRPTDNNQFDSWFEENRFSYEIAVPFSLRDNVPNYMVNDLNRFFSATKHIEAVKENRIYPAYILRKSANAKTLDSLNWSKADLQSGMKKWDASFDSIRSYLTQNIQNLSLAEPVAFIDETNIEDQTKVSIILPTDLTDKSRLQAILLRQGFILSVEDRGLDIYVIKDVKGK